MNQKELIIRGIKVLDISLLGIYYLFGGITLSYLIDLLMPIFDESSSEIRDRSMKNLDINNFLPEAIKDYINKNGLYKLPGHNK